MQRPLVPMLPGALMDANGNGRFTFGPAAGNSIPAEWVEPLLSKLFAQYREAFGARLAEVAAEQLAGVQVRAVKPRSDARD